MGCWNSTTSVLPQYWDDPPPVYTRAARTSGTTTRTNGRTRGWRQPIFDRIAARAHKTSRVVKVLSFVCFVAVVSTIAAFRIKKEKE
ncbi:hypothetical protein EV122DRAFT_281141 [Schizophyllum commune]